MDLWYKAAWIYISKYDENFSYKLINKNSSLYRVENLPCIIVAWIAEKCIDAFLTGKRLMWEEGLGLAYVARFKLGGHSSLFRKNRKAW